MNKIGVLDYGAGNLNSVFKILKKLNATTLIVKNKNNLKNIDKLIIPGVGSFEACIKYLKKKELVIPLKKFVVNNPTLAICLGMQILMNKSEEANDCKGLSILDGNVELISKFNKNAMVPHIGWTKLLVKNNSNKNFFTVFKDKYFYYSNSYVCNLNKLYPQRCFFLHDGNKFVSAIKNNNLIATQFHPEISNKQGFEFYKNFMDLK